MRRTSVSLYEVVATVPGSSITLRNILDDSCVTVAERTASRSVSRHEYLVARVLPRGCSGQPELEGGLLAMPPMIVDSAIAALESWKRQCRDESLSDADFREQLPPLFHEGWLMCIFEPAVPEFHNTDGEKMLITRISFHVDDADLLSKALDGGDADGIEASGEGHWSWAGSSRNEDQVSLGTFQIRGVPAQGLRAAAATVNAARR